MCQIIGNHFKNHVLFWFLSRLCLIYFGILASFSLNAQVVLFETDPSPNNDTITICEGQTITYTNTSIGFPLNANTNWTFQGGSPNNSNQFGPHEVDYNNDGTYTASLSIQGDQYEVTVVVLPSFTPTLNAATTGGVTTSTYNGTIIFRRCNNNIQNFNFNFTDPNISSYPSGTTYTLEWGDGTANGTTAPSGLLHLYAPGEYNLIYTVTFPNGCSQVQEYIVYNGSSPPALSISGSGLSFCKPNDYEIIISAPYEPPNTTYTIQVNDGSAPIVLEGLGSLPYSYFHNFNVNSCGTTTVINSNPYEDSYSIQITASNGCNPAGTFAAIGPIQVSESLEVDFSIDKETVCIGDNVLITDETFPGANVSQGYCDTIYGLFWEIEPSNFTYTGALGDGGNYVLDATDPNYNWYGWTPGTSELNVQFTVPGTYEVTLYAGNDCGVDSLTKTICVVGPVIADFDLPLASACAPIDISPQNNTNQPLCDIDEIFDWEVTLVQPVACGNGSGVSPSTSNAFAPQFSFTEPGVYQIELTTSLDPLVPGTQCLPTTHIELITIKDDPVVDLEDPLDICEGGSFIPVVLVDSCLSETPLTFNWNFNTENITPSADAPSPESSVLLNPGAVTIPLPGTYDFYFTATNECGTDTSLQTIVVYPLAELTASSVSGSCVNEPIQLTGTSTGIPGLATWSSSVSGGNFNPSNTSLNAVYTPPFDYAGPIVFSLTYVDPLSPCPTVVATTTTVVNLNATAEAGSYAPICIDQSLELNGIIGGAASQGQWSTSAGGVFSDPSSLTSTYTPPLGFIGTITLILSTDDPVGPCLPATDSVLIQILPPPVVDAGQDIIICQSGTTPPLNATFSGTATGVVWSSITGGTFSPSPNIVAPTWTPPITFNGQATLTVTTTGTGPCPAVTDELLVTANAIPFIADTALTICSGVTINFVPSDQLPNVIPSGSQYTWSVTDNSLVNGESSSVSASVSVDQTLINPSSSEQTLTYQITPVASASGGCAGPPFVLDVTVLPELAVNPLNDITACNGESIAITPANSVPGTLFTWTSSNGGIGSGSTGTGSLSFTATNASNVPVSSDFSVLPSYSVGAVTCSGSPELFTVTVNPTPTVDPVGDQDLCNGSSTSEIIFTGSVAGTVFDWVNNDASIGLSPVGSGSISSFTAQNSGSNTVVSTVTVTPAANSCAGPSEVFSITVYATPLVSNSTTSETICSGSSSASVVWTSLTSGTTYSWIGSVTSGSVAGFTATGSGDLPSMVLTNSGVVQGTLTYTVTPEANGCAGPSFTYTINVDPIPDLSPIPSQTICGGSSFTTPSFVSDVALTNYTWTLTNSGSIPPSVTGYTTNGVGPLTGVLVGNSGTDPVTLLYSITPEASGCFGIAENFSLTVNPAPVVEFSPVAQTICTGGSTQLVTLSSTTSGATFSWDVTGQPSGLNGVTQTTGTSTIPIFTLDHTELTPQVLTIEAIASTTGSLSCPGTPSQYTITINPAPSVDNPSDQVICNGTPTQAVVFTGTGTSYTWTNDLPSIGLSGSGTGNITVFTAVNGTSSPVTAAVIVTSQFTGGGTTCPGGQQNFTFTVNPTPTVTDPADQVVCNGASTAQVTFTGTGTSYTWVNNTPSIGLGASGTGPISPFTAVNNGTTPVTATITVTPVFTGSGLDCSGPSQTFTITINPTPSVNDPSDLVVCSSSSTSPVNFSGTGTSYSWTNDTPGIGLAASGTGNIASFTATNPGVVPLVATITVNPDFTGGNASCSGVGQTFTITVNPIPLVNDLPNQTVCNGTSLSALLFTGTGTGYTWTNSTPSIGLAANGTGNIPSFTGSNGGVSPLTGVVTVTPQYSNAGLTCSGSVQTIDLTVNPTPTLTDPQDIVVCNGSATSAVTFSGTGTSYSWTNSNPGIGLSATGTGNIASFTGVNNSTSPVTATITVVPEYNFNGVNCTGPSQSFTITVNPTPTVTDPADQVICNGSSTQAVLFTGTGTSYSWSNSTPGIGLAATGTGNIASFTAINGGSTPLIGTITVTPQYANAGLTCNGNQQLFQITVNPAPTVQFNVPEQTICSQGTSVGVSLTSPTPGAAITWSVTNIPASIAGVNVSSGTNLIPTYTLVNSGNTPAIVQFLASAETTGQAACPGGGTPYSITVNPTPTVTDPADQVICAGEITTQVIPAGTGTSYSWVNDQSSTGLVSAGTGSIPAFTGQNTGSSPLVSTITVTPIFTNNSVSCPGPDQSFTISVNPIPSVGNMPDLTFCNGALTTVVSPVGTGTSYNWTNNTASIGLGSNGTGSIPAFTAVNPSTSTSVTATIEYTPFFTNAGLTCEGTPQDFQLIVNPTPIVNDPSDQVICNGTPTQAVVFTGTGTSYTWTNDLPSIGLSGSGTGNITVFTAVNGTSSPVTAAVIVTSQFTGGGTTCPGGQQNFTFTVNPTPTVTDPADQVVCNGASTAQVTFTGTGTSYTWVNNTPSIGLGASGTGPISPFTAVNNGTTPVTATITVTPVFTGSGLDCSGPSQTFTITINPTPSVNDPSDLVVCSSSSTSPVNFSGTGTSYSWTNDTPGIGLAASGTGNIASFTATNPGVVPLVATITVNPDFTGGNASCSGVGQTFTITVNPIPLVNDLPNQTVCNGTSLSALLFTGTGTGYTWTNSTPSIGLAANGTGNIPSFTGSNGGVSPLTGVVTVTPQYSNAGLTCSGSVQTIDLTVNPTPTLTDPQDIVVCNGSATSAVTFSGTGTSYSWTNSNPGIGLSATGTGNIASFTGVNNSTSPVTATITVVPEYNFNGVNCTGPSQSFTITVNPTPTVTDPADQVICNGSSTQAVLFTGTGTSYSWSNSTPGIGLAATGTGNIASFTAINGGSTPLIGTITVTPQYANAGLTCNGNQQLFQITVNPTPIVNDPPDLVVCNNSIVGAVNFTGTGTIYQWTNSTPAIGLGSSGSNNIPSFNAVNPSNTLQEIATISVTAFYDQAGVSCQGTTQNFTITVNPTTILNDPADQIVCNGLQTSAVNFTGTGTSYQWVNDLSSIGLSASGTGNIPSFTSLNNGSVAVSANVSVTPLFTSIDGTVCPGTPQTFTYTINPSPTAAPIADFSVCNNTTLNVSLTANINSTFVWFAEPNPNVTGDVNIPQPSATVTNTLTNQSTGMQDVIYHVIPTSVPEGCLGAEITFVVEIVPDVEVISPLNYEICSGGFVNALLQSNVPANYTWIATDNPNVTGESTISQSGSFINDQLVNNTTVPQIVIYTVFPTSVTGSCPGSIRVISVLVRPPLTLLNPDLAEICSGESPNLQLQANVDASFNWFAFENPNTSGESTNVQTSDIIDDVLVNPTAQPQVVNYSVVASSTLNGCVSPVFTINVIVNPLPQLLNLESAICSGENTSIQLISNLPSQFTWFAQNAPLINGETQQVQNSNSINDVLINTTNSPQTVYYSITITESATGCVGPATILPLVVNPLPIIQFSTNDQVLCSLSPVVFVNNSDPSFDYDWQFGDGSGSQVFEPEHIYGAIGSYNVTLTGTNPFTGCVNSASNQITLEDSPPIGFVASDVAGCVVFDVTFIDTVGLVGSTLTWNFGDGETSNQPGAVDHQYNQGGCYDVTLTVTSQNGCVSSLTQSDLVCAFEQPFADFVIVSDTMPVNDPVFEFINTSLNGYTYLWYFGDGSTSVSENPIHTYPEEPGSYVVTMYAFNEVGCYDSTFNTVVIFEELLFYVPNSFTPNDDGTNDIFLPVMTSGFDRDSYSLSIFNRWGEEIFYTNDPNEGWDGSYFGTESQIGVYTWKIIFGGLQNEDEKEYVGHVTLVK